MANGRVREYIGARYVPIFSDPVQWNIDNTYEPLMMTQKSGETFMSKQYVPAGIELPDTSNGQESNDYWVHMSNWNAQVEGYREEVLRYAEEVIAYNGRITAMETALPVSDFDSENTVADTISTLETTMRGLVSALAAKTMNTYATVADMLDDESLEVGAICFTSGYYASDDGGFAFYKVQESNTGTYNVIELDNGLYASLLDIGFVTPRMFGCTGDGSTNDNDNMTLCFNSPAKVIWMQKGTYRAYINNRTSDRIIIVDPDCIIDGVFHVAIGNGPEITSGAPITSVKNVVVLGCLTSTVRVGSYYCNGVYIDKIRLIGTDMNYPNQTTEGGCKGVHFYFGTKNLTVNKIDVEEATQIYGIGLDIGDITDSEHQLDNINIGTCNVKATGVKAVYLNRVNNIHIDKLHISGQDVRSEFIGVVNCKIDYLHINSSTAQGVMLQNCTFTEIANAEFKNNGTNQGILVSSGCTFCNFGTLKSIGCGVPISINGSNNIHVDSIYSYGDDYGAFYVDSCTGIGIDYVYVAAYTQVSGRIRGSNDCYIGFFNNQAGSSDSTNYGIEIFTSNNIYIANLVAIGLVHAIRTINSSELIFDYIHFKNCTVSVQNSGSSNVYARICNYQGTPEPVLDIHEIVLTTS